MAIDTETAIQNAATEGTTTNYNVGILKKAQNNQRLEGQLAVRLIDQSGPQMTKTEDGHISVRA
ncbi:MAG TPA: hypothetical protein VMU50_23390 [Polyangia bacterium]|nr:hypothetical protein [Polyangia bacterium]